MLTEAGGVAGRRDRHQPLDRRRPDLGNPGPHRQHRRLSPDKNWIVCDNTATSPFYGNCYTEWDDNGAGNRMEMSRSTDGGLTWSAPATNNTGIIGGQPVVRPDGTVIVPTANANETAIGAFNSTNGGVELERASPRSPRSGTTRSRAACARGRCPRPRSTAPARSTSPGRTAASVRACKANDIVIAHSLNATGTSWSAVTRVPIDATNSGIDHFIPGLAVNKATSGAAAQLGLTYYFYPKGSTQLSVGFISSANAGSTWSTPQTIVSGMTSTWAATTSQGRMVGDYISTSYGSDNLAHGVFGAANAPTTGAGDELLEHVLDNCVAPIDTFTLGPRVRQPVERQRPGPVLRQRRRRRPEPLEHRRQQRVQAPRLNRRWPGAPGRNDR